MRHYVLDVARGEQVGLFDKVEHLVLLPGGVGEALVLWVAFDHWRRVGAHHAAGGVVPQRQDVLPIVHLRAH